MRRKSPVVETFHFSLSGHLAAVFLLITLLYFCVPSLAQDYIYDTGSPVFSVAQPAQLGFVNLANGNLHVEIPIASAPQRGHLTFAARLIYDSRIWQIVNTG